MTWIRNKWKSFLYLDELIFLKYNTCKVYSKPQRIPRNRVQTFLFVYIWPIFEIQKFFANIQVFRQHTFVTNIRTAYWNRLKDDQDEDRRRRLAASSQADHWLDDFESCLHEGDQLCDSTTRQESKPFLWIILNFRIDTDSVKVPDVRSARHWKKQKIGAADDLLIDSIRSKVQYFKMQWDPVRRSVFNHVKTKESLMNLLQTLWNRPHLTQTWSFLSLNSD